MISEIDNGKRKELRLAMYQDVREIAKRLREQGKTNAARELLMEMHSAIVDIPEAAAELRADIKML